MSEKQHTIEDLRSRLESAEGQTRSLLLAELARRLEFSDLKTAMGYARESLEIARDLVAESSGVQRDKHEDKRMLASALSALGGCAIVSWDIQTAEQSLQEARTLWEEIEDHLQIAQSLHQLSYLCRLQDKPEASLVFMDQAFDAYSRTGEHSELAGFHAERAYVLQHLKREEDAFNEKEAALRELDRIDDRHARAMVYLAIANYYMMKGDFPSATKYFEKTLPAFREAGSTYNLLAALHNLGLALKNMNESQGALRAFEEKAILARNGGFTVVEAESYKQISDIYRQYGNFDHAISASEKSLHLYRALGDKSRILSALASLGSLFMECGNADDGMQRLRETSELLKEIGRNIFHYHAISALIEHTPENCRLEDLVVYLLEDKKVESPAGITKPVYDCLLLAKAYEKLGRPEDARTECQKAVALSRSFENVCLQADALCRLGIVELRAGDTENARKRLRNALFLASDCHDWRIRRNIHIALRDYHESQGELKEALEHQKEMAKLERDTLLAQTPRRVERLMLESNVAQLEREIETFTTAMTDVEEQLATERRIVGVMAAKEERATTALRSIRAQLREGLPTSTQEDYPALLTSALAVIEEVGGVRPRMGEQAPEQSEEVYIRRLQEKFPKLTPKELKVCALLRLNVSTKELARLLVVSPRAIETYRYRIRRKLQVESGTDLNTAISRMMQE